MMYVATDLLTAADWYERVETEERGVFGLLDAYLKVGMTTI